MDAFDAIGEIVVWIIKWSFTALTIYYAFRSFIRILRKRKPHVKAYKVGSYNDYHVQKGDYEKNTRSSSFFEADYVKGEDTVIDDYHSLYQYEIEGTIYKTDIHDKLEFGWGPAKKELILYYNNCLKKELVKVLLKRKLSKLYHFCFF